jgi:hypothetical protein
MGDISALLAVTAHTNKTIKAADTETAATSQHVMVDTHEEAFDERSFYRIDPKSQPYDTPSTPIKEEQWYEMQIEHERQRHRLDMQRERAKLTFMMIAFVAVTLIMLGLAFKTFS